MAARGIDVSYETIRCWTIKFGPQIARRLKRLRLSPCPRWHLDEVVCSIGGKRMFLWRAVDDEGEVLDLVVQRRRDTEAALVLLNRLLRTSLSSQNVSLPTVFDLIRLLLRCWAFVLCIHPAGFGRTIGRKTPTCRSDDESDNSSCSSPRLQPSDSSPPPQRSTTPSTPNVTSSAGPRFDASAPRPPPLGRRPSPKILVGRVSFGRRRLT